MSWCITPNCNGMSSSCVSDHSSLMLSNGMWTKTAFSHTTQLEIDWWCRLHLLKWVKYTEEELYRTEGPIFGQQYQWDGCQPLCTGLPPSARQFNFNRSRTTVQGLQDNYSHSTGFLISLNQSRTVLLEEDWSYLSLKDISYKMHECVRHPTI